MALLSTLKIIGLLISDNSLFYLLNLNLHLTMCIVVGTGVLVSALVICFIWSFK